VFAVKKLISLAVSIALLAIIYCRIDVGALARVFQHCDAAWLALSLGMVVPLTLLTARRLQQLMPQSGQLGFGEANRLILVASVLNLVLPSKMGDLAKAWFMRDRGHLPGSLALSLVVFEKACDLLSLLAWCVFGLAWIKWSDSRALSAFHLPVAWAERLGAAQESLVFWLAGVIVTGSLCAGILLIGSARFAAFFFNIVKNVGGKKAGAKIEKLANGWREMHAYFWESKTRLLIVTGTSLFIWFLHLLQIWMFILALNASAPFVANLALSPLAILAGLLPLTFAGVGTRDAALVFLYAPYFAAPTAAALGILCTARYLLPALGGLPFAGDYMQRRREPVAVSPSVP
jgi:uncharacterized membrane protein YbhN (UPF0104 family)